MWGILFCVYLSTNTFFRNWHWPSRTGESSPTGETEYFDLFSKISSSPWLWIENVYWLDRFFERFVCVCLPGSKWNFALRAAECGNLHGLHRLLRHQPTEWWDHHCQIPGRGHSKAQENLLHGKNYSLLSMKC